MAVGTKRRAALARELVFSQSPLRVACQTGVQTKGEKNFVPLLELFSSNFVDSYEDRKTHISTATGLPVEQPPEKTTGTASVNRIAVEVLISRPIISFNMIVGDNNNFRFISIGCTDRTHYIIVRGNISFTFYVPSSSVTPRDAVHELLTNNLVKGPCVYLKSSTIIQDFFELILAAVYPEAGMYQTVIKTADDMVLPCRVYFDPAKPKDSSISIAGYVYPFDLNRYPRTQLNKAVRRLPQSEVTERIAAPRPFNKMSTLHRRQVVG